MLHEIKKGIYRLGSLIVPCDCKKEARKIDSDRIDFDVSMDKGSYYYERCIHAKNGVYTIATYPQPAAELYNFFKALYEKNYPSINAANNEIKIPLIAHMIWAGGSFPEQYHDFRKSWIDIQSNWTHILWVDNPENYRFGKVVEDISTLKEDLLSGKYVGTPLVIDFRKITLFNQQFYDKGINFGEKTDILKYELVYMFGGVYIDIDFECIQPLDYLNKEYHFYVGIQPLDETLALGAALFGGLPGDPILKHCIETIQDDRNKKSVIERTGPVHFTRAFWQTANKVPGKVIALPASYFYPVSIRQKSLTRVQMHRLLKPESYALHHWAGSWLDLKKIFKFFNK